MDKKSLLFYTLDRLTELGLKGFNKSEFCRGFSSSRVLCTKPYIAPLETISNQQETTGYESSSDSSLQYDDFYPPDETSKNLAHNLKEERRSLEYIDEEPERYPF